MRKLLFAGLVAVLTLAPLTLAAEGPSPAAGSDLPSALTLPGVPEGTAPAAPTDPTDPTSLPFGGNEPLFVDCIDGCIWGYWQCLEGCGSEDWFCRNMCEQGRDNCIRTCSP